MQKRFVSYFCVFVSLFYAIKEACETYTYCSARPHSYWENIIEHPVGQTIGRANREC